MRSPQRWIYLMSVCVLSTVLLFQTGRAYHPTVQLSWELPRLGGGRLALSDWRGRIVVAAYGATWCPPCKTELPVLQALAEEYRGKNVEIVWISIDDRSVSDQVLAEYVNRLGVRFPVVRDVTGATLGPFKQTSVPFLVVIDRGGRLVDRPLVGFSDAGAFKQKVSDLIKAGEG